MEGLNNRLSTTENITQNKMSRTKHQKIKDRKQKKDHMLNQDIRQKENV